MKHTAYATKRTFGGRRARVGDVVVLACPRYDMRQFWPSNAPDQEMVLRSGVVSTIAADDLPCLEENDGQVADPTWWSFVETTTEEEIEAMEISQWTWPLELRKAKPPVLPPTE